MSLFGLLIIVFFAWLAMSVAHRVLCLACRIVPWSLLGTAAILAGLAMFVGDAPPHPAEAEVVPVVLPAIPLSDPKMPERAGSIPVGIELAQAEPQSAPAVAAPTAPAAPPTLEPRPARPDWVDAPAKLVANVYRVPVKSGLFASVPECQRALDKEIKRAADHYVNEYLGDREASQLVDVSLDYLKKNVQRAEFAEVVTSTSVGPMHEIHALLEFDDAVRADFRRLRHEALVTERLGWVGGVAAGVLACLAATYGYLRFFPRREARDGHRAGISGAASLIVAAGLISWCGPF